MTEQQHPVWGRLPVTDALRAVAIVAVVLFHTFPAAVPGGFIGVDIFFVISGFVIALNYLPGLVNGDSGFGTFFLRRIRRLVPAFFAMMLVVSVLSFVLLRPVLLKQFGISLAAQAVYAQNIAFWVQGDYFDRAYLKPLLHTWSLGVEEQFYFVFPLLILAFRRSYRWGIAALGLTALASLAAGFPVAGISPKTVFYLLPFRIWEFAGGIAVALWFLRGGTHGMLPRSIGIPGLLAGLAMIAASIALFDEGATLPGVQSLLAVAGTMIVCACQRGIGPALTRAAGHRALQHVGKTSYSWYLWHWPVVVFYYVVYGTTPGAVPGLACIAGGYAIGTLSYARFERGNQHKPSLAGSIRPLAMVGAMAALCVGIGAVALATNGAMFRYPTAQANLLNAQMDRSDGRCSYTQRLRDYAEEICRIGSAAGSGGILVVGDSHAAKAKELLREIADRRGIPIFLTKRNCRPTEIGATKYCSVKWWDHVVRDARRDGVARIVVVAHYEPGTTEAVYRSSFARVADAGIPIFLQASPPEGAWFDPATRIDPVPSDDPDEDRTVARYTAARHGQIAALRAVAAGNGNVTLLDPIPLLCPEGICRRDGADGYPLYSDPHHLSSAGVRVIAPIYAPLFDGLRGPDSDRATAITRGLAK